jgi:hypothetical protein
MSRQAEDLLVRTLKDASSLFGKERYKKALEKLDKAEKMAEKAKRTDILLSQKGLLNSLTYIKAPPVSGKGFFLMVQNKDYFVDRHSRTWRQPPCYRRVLKKGRL